MEHPERVEAHQLQRLRHRVSRIAGWAGLLGATWLLGILLLQLLFGRELERLQIIQQGREMALQLRLVELTLERYPPALISELTGLDLEVAVEPSRHSTEARTIDHRIASLRQELCARLTHCPRLLIADEGSGQPSSQVWIELISPLEPVWLRGELPKMRSWPPDLTLLMLALLGAVLSSGAIYLLIEVKRPLQSLERALSRVGEGSDPDALPSHGAPEVQSITQRFNAMVQRLAATRRERDSMLAGIAHDLRAPITRLQFRLSLLQLDSGDHSVCQADLQSLERITGQFLLYAGGGDREPMVNCPLHQWLAEAVASQPTDLVQLDVRETHAQIRPVALARALNNLIENALSYGATPVVVRLYKSASSAVIEVWDQGNGIPNGQWERALQPFQRLDQARGGQGHCGLGLAIVSHVMKHHQGSISALRDFEKPGRFAVVLDIPLTGPEQTEIMQIS